MAHYWCDRCDKPRQDDEHGCNEVREVEGTADRLICDYCLEDTIAEHNAGSITLAEINGQAVKPGEEL